MRITIACLLALASASAGLSAEETGTAEGAVVVRRFVTVPEPLVPPTSGGNDARGPRCAGRGPRALRKGDEIRLWLSPRMARMDEPGVSFVLRLDDAERGTFYVLFHDEKSYSELRYPPNPKELRTAQDQMIADAGVNLSETRITSPLSSTAVTARGLAATEHRLSTANRQGATVDLAMQLLPDPVLGDVAFRLEALRPAIGSGRLDDVWRTAGLTSGIVLGSSRISRWLDDPPNETVVRLASFERRPLPPGDLRRTARLREDPLLARVLPRCTATAAGLAANEPILHPSNPGRR